MADVTINSFDETKQFGRVLYQKGRDLVEAELNESQDIERVLRRRAMRSIFGDGFIATGYKILASANPNEILIEAGDALIQGEHLNNPSQFPVQGLTTPGVNRTDIVYLKVREIEITSIDDPSIEFSDIGETARRIKIEREVLVDEGSVVLPTITGDLHDAGIHYELIGYLFRTAGNATIVTAEIVDSRRIIGFTFLNEDKNLEVVGGGDITYSSGTGQMSFTDAIRIIQPSTSGHAFVQTTESPFFLPAAGDVAYIVLNRSALVDYDVSIIIGTWNTIPNNPNAFPLFYRHTDGRVYAVEGTFWDDASTHKMRQNPFTGLIFDADVSPLANLNGAKIAVNSIPLDRLIGPIPDTLTSGLIVLSEDPLGTCPAGYTKIDVGTNDTYLQLSGPGSGAAMTPTGSNTHGHGSHSHSDGSYSITLPLLDIFDLCYGCGGLPTFDALQFGVGAGIRNQNFSVNGTSGSTTISTVNHEPKHIRMSLCKKS